MSTYKKYGLDLSKHNGTVDFTSVAKSHDFVILRAGYGKVSSQKDSKFDEYYKSAKSAGLKVGVYWYSYALSTSDAKKEAETCYSIIKGKEFEYPIFLDMEDADSYKKKNGMPSNSTLVSICDTFCDTMKGYKFYPGVYASESWFNSQLAKLGSTYPKWVAKWGTNDGTLQTDLSSTYKLHQFTSKYKLGSNTYDRDVSYYDFESYIKKNSYNNLSSSSSSSSSSSTSTSIEQLAKDTLKGKYGTGSTRKKKLGSNYDSVQKLINKWYDVADDVIAGKYGNGDTRKTKLKKAGYDYDTIQSIVNEKLGK